jgi:multimeric flavodoxin WrbA
LTQSVAHSHAGHVQKLAEAEAEGAKEVDGVDVTLMQVNGQPSTAGCHFQVHITPESHSCPPVSTGRVAFAPDRRMRVLS